MGKSLDKFIDMFRLKDDYDDYDEYDDFDDEFDDEDVDDIPAPVVKKKFFKNETAETMKENISFTKKMIQLPIRTNQHQTKMKRRQSQVLEIRILTRNQALGPLQSQIQALLEILVQPIIPGTQVIHKIIAQVQQHSHLLQFTNTNGPK